MRSAHVGATIIKDPRPIWFDPQRRAATPELKAAIKSLIAHLEQREADLGLRKRARKETDRQSFHLAVECIACNLGVLTLMNLDRPLAVPRRASVMWANGRYSVPVYGQHFLDALDLMAHSEVALIEDLTRGYRFASGNKHPSTIKPTPSFVARVRPALSTWEAFSQAELGEVIILKRSKDHAPNEGARIDYPETANTRRRRKEVQAINRVLRRAPIKLVTDVGQTCFTEEGQPIDPTHRAVRRIFNNGSWYEGGRLFDGFWENMRRPDRFRYLRICTAGNPEGERVANVDFSQLFPTLAYHRADRTVPAGVDLYDIVGDGGTSRDGWKKLVNALLFVDGELTRWPERTSTLFPKGTKLVDAVALIRHVHAPIAHSFGTGIGFRLMLIESQILIDALGVFAHRGITALPLHDSVLVARSAVKDAEAVMSEAFASYTADARAKLKVDFG